MTAGEQHNPPLQVVGFVATKVGDADRGPQITMRPDDAQYRLLNEGELVWVYGPRRHELATVALDPTLPRGSVVLRDVAGVSPSEVVKVIKVGTDRPILRGGGELA